MRDSVDPVEPGVVELANVAVLICQATVALLRQRPQRRFTKKEAIEHADAIAAFEKLAAKLQPDVARAASNEDVQGQAPAAASRARRTSRNSSSAVSHEGSDAMPARANVVFSSAEYIGRCVGLPNEAYSIGSIGASA